MRSFINVEDIEKYLSNGKLKLPKDAILTPYAMDYITEKKISVLYEEKDSQSGREIQVNKNSQNGLPLDGGRDKAADHRYLPLADRKGPCHWNMGKCKRTSCRREYSHNAF